MAYLQQHKRTVFATSPETIFFSASDSVAAHSPSCATVVFIPPSDGLGAWVWSRTCSSKMLFIKGRHVLQVFHLDHQITFMYDCQSTIYLNQNSAAFLTDWESHILMFMKCFMLVIAWTGAIQSPFVGLELLQVPECIVCMVCKAGYGIACNSLANEWREIMTLQTYDFT